MCSHLFVTESGRVPARIGVIRYRWVMPAIATRRVALYARQSKEDPEGIERQRPRTAALAKVRGWTVVDRYEDDDVTASKTRGPGSGWARMLEDADAGRIDTVISVDVDRLLRSTRDINTLIDHGLTIVTVDGEIDLSTADGEFRATMLAAIARFEVRRKGERQSRAQQQRAEKGKPAKGIRPTGYTLGGEIIEDEAKIIRRIFREFLAGETLKGIAKGLQNDGIQTRRGGTWSSSSVASILTNARYAGRSVYKGEDVGAATWPAIISEQEFATVQARLADPSRKTRGPSTARKHLGSGLYFCNCGLRVRASSSMGNTAVTRYTCRHTCFYRSAKPIDDFVLAVIRARLAMPDLADLLAKPADEARSAELAAQRKQLMGRLEQTHRDYDDDLIDGRRYKAKTEKIRAELEAVQRELGKLHRSGGADSVIMAPDPAKAFDNASLDVRRATIELLAKVTLSPGKHGSRTFDPETVKIDWYA